MQEVWQPVVGFEGLYEVSDQGRVKALARKRWNGHVWINQPEQVLKCSKGKAGYPIANFMKGGKRTTRTVHSLVLEAFVGPRPPGYECRHLNGIRSDARLANLAWGTPSDNDIDRTIHNTMPRGESHYSSTLTENQVRSIRQLFLTKEADRRTVADIAVMFNTTTSNVYRIVERKTWKHVQ